MRILLPRAAIVVFNPGLSLIDALIDVRGIQQPVNRLCLIWKWYPAGTYILKFRDKPHAYCRDAIILLIYRHHVLKIG